MRTIPPSPSGSAGKNFTVQAGLGEVADSWIVLGSILVLVLIVVATLAYLLARLVVPRTDAEHLPAAIDSIARLVRAVVFTTWQHRLREVNSGEEREGATDEPKSAR